MLFLESTYTTSRISLLCLVLLVLFLDNTTTRPPNQWLRCPHYVDEIQSLTLSKPNPITAMQEERPLTGSRFFSSACWRSQLLLLCLSRILNLFFHGIRISYSLCPLSLLTSCSFSSSSVLALVDRALEANGTGFCSFVWRVRLGDGALVANGTGF